MEAVDNTRIALGLFSLSHGCTSILLLCPAHFIRVFLIDVSNVDDENPLRLVRQRQNVGSNMMETREKKSVKTKCLPIDALHWTFSICWWSSLIRCAHSSHLFNERRRKSNKKKRRLVFSKINKRESKSNTWWCRCYRCSDVFIHRDRWCSVHWLVYLFKLMLGRTAVRWIQSNADQHWLGLMFVQMIFIVSEWRAGFLNLRLFGRENIGSAWD